MGILYNASKDNGFLRDEKTNFFNKKFIIVSLHNIDWLRNLPKEIIRGTMMFVLALGILSDIPKDKGFKLRLDISQGG